jgi:hypothetical protein
MQPSMNPFGPYVSSHGKRGLGRASCGMVKAHNSQRFQPARCCEVLKAYNSLPFHQDNVYRTRTGLRIRLVRGSKESATVVKLTRALRVEPRQAAPRRRLARGKGLGCPWRGAVRSARLSTILKVRSAWRGKDMQPSTISVRLERVGRC